MAEILNVELTVVHEDAEYFVSVDACTDGSWEIAGSVRTDNEDPNLPQPVETAVKEFFQRMSL